MFFLLLALSIVSPAHYPKRQTPYTVNAFVDDVYSICSIGSILHARYIHKRVFNACFDESWLMTDDIRLLPHELSHLHDIACDATKILHATKIMLDGDEYETVRHSRLWNNIDIMRVFSPERAWAVVQSTICNITF